MLYFKTTSKMRKVMEASKVSHVVCHYCKQLGGTLKRERDIKGKKLKNKEGKAIYTHSHCKVSAILNQLQDQQTTQI